jgi:hypothetical protein
MHHSIAKHQPCKRTTCAEKMQDPRLILLQQQASQL